MLVGIVVVIWGVLFWVLNGMVFTVGPGETLEQGRQIFEWIGEQRGSSNFAPAVAAQPTAPPTVDPTSECGQVIAWSEETRSRNVAFADMDAEFSTFDLNDLDPATVRGWITDLDRIRQEQQLSDPPPLARRSNDLLVQTTRETASLFRLIVRAQERTLTAEEQAEAVRIAELVPSLFDKIDVENQRLIDSCGAEFYAASVVEEARAATDGPTRETHSCDGYREWANDPALVEILNTLDDDSGKVLTLQVTRLAQGKPVDVARLRQISGSLNAAGESLRAIEPPPIGQRSHELMLEFFGISADVAEDLIQSRVDRGKTGRQQEIGSELAAEFELVVAQCE